MEIMKIAYQKKKWRQNFIEIDILKLNKKNLRMTIWKVKIIWKSRNWKLFENRKFGNYIKIEDEEINK